ncbi:MAG: hypothetical protein AAGI07_02765 [Bacteroidota bacterium]
MYRITFLLLAVLMQFKSLAIHKENKLPEFVEETDLYAFYSHFWLNMHHFLQQEVLMNQVKDSSVIASGIWNRMDNSEQKKWENAINFYKETLVEKDLRMDDYMWAFKNWVTTQEMEVFANVPDSFSIHCSHLQKVSGLYKKYFWEEHTASNQEILDTYYTIIDSTEETVAAQLATLTRSFWQKEKIRVDICYYAKSTRRNLRNRPYTSVEPTHVVMNSANQMLAPKGNWIELLYHEASHHLISSRSGFIGGTIIDVANVMGKKPPRSLWHAYLFYFSGIITQQLLIDFGIEDYKIYMLRNKVFTYYYPFLEQSLTLYMHHNITLHNATNSIITAYYEDR